MFNVSQQLSSVRGATFAAAASILLAAAVPAAAHHAFAAEFDASQPLELKGTVTKVRWVNPHSWLYFDVVDDKGNVTNWGVEFSTPNGLARLGLTKADVATGTPIAISGYKSKNGGPFGYSVKLTLADGRTFQTGNSQDATAQARAE
jgi:hypothetical protein